MNNPTSSLLLSQHYQPNAFADTGMHYNPKKEEQPSPPEIPEKKSPAE